MELEIITNLVHFLLNFGFGFSVLVLQRYDKDFAFTNKKAKKLFVQPTFYQHANTQSNTFSFRSFCYSCYSCYSFFSAYARLVIGLLK